MLGLATCVLPEDCDGDNPNLEITAGVITHSIYGTGIFWLMFMVNVGKYTSPMDPMGYITPNNALFPLYIGTAIIP